MNTYNPFTQFRSEVYQNFNKRADSMLELVDALSSHQHARSVAELSLADGFHYGYSALYKSIAACSLSNQQLAHLAAPYIPQPERRNFWLLAQDVSSHPCLYAECLHDRGYVYEPTVIRGNKPVTSGHQYATVVALPEKEAADAAWVIPLSTARVASTADKELVGAALLHKLLTDPEMPFYGELCVTVQDSSYRKPAYLHAQARHPNQVDSVRVRGNRCFYRQLQPDPAAAPARGHPQWYGECFALREPETWGTPDATHSLKLCNQQGKTYRAEVQAWHNLLLRGKRKPVALPMQQHPFTLVRVQLYRDDDMPVYRRALWFIVIGARRAEIPADVAYHAYRQRFDIEHTYRFGKQRLLLTAYQTPEVTHEETWWRLVHRAYVQLWVARPLAERLPRPWEHYLPTMRTATPLSPALVQRDFARIIRECGSPARTLKPRGYSPGRAAGTPGTTRERQNIVLKSKKVVAAPVAD